MKTSVCKDVNSRDDTVVTTVKDEGELSNLIKQVDLKIREMEDEILTINGQMRFKKERVQENMKQIKIAKKLPFLVSNVVEILTMKDESQTFDGDVKVGGKSVVIKTSQGHKYFLPEGGLVSPEDLKPGHLVGTHTTSYLILDALPKEYDKRVKAMEINERPTVQYTDIGGLDKQLEELMEALILPLMHKEKFETVGVKPPKGVLLYGPPGTGKTLIARASAALIKSCFIRLSGSQLVQMHIGDGAKLISDVFSLAKDKKPSIIFIDEIDAVCTKRHNSSVSGDMEVQRTMIELLNQLDGFESSDDIKVIAATNRVDIIDPALLRSGRFDKKIEFSLDSARARILQIHSRKMKISRDVDFNELARSTEVLNGAQCKAVCVEAGMIALRKSSSFACHDDFMNAILEVNSKKKTNASLQNIYA